MSLMTNNIEHLICPLYILFLKMSVYVFCPFSNWIGCLSTIEFYKFFIYSRHLFLVKYAVYKYFLPVCSFSCLSYWLSHSKSFPFLLGPICKYLLLCIILLVSSQNSLSSPNSWIFSHVFFCKFYIFTLMIHFELNFV